MRTGLTLLLLSIVLTGAAARAEFAPATAKGPVNLGCPGDSFFDPRNGGECWSCPKGYARTIFPVDGPDACEKSASDKVAKASFEHAWGCDSDEREFFDPRKGGQCWSCPKNRPRRTAYAVTDDRACATKEIVGEKLAPAKFEHKFKGCGGRAFYDPRKGGQCWSCPKGYSRTLEGVTSDKACAKTIEGGTTKATRTASVCPAGAFADPDGTCYACPASAPIRTLYPVTGPKACASTLLEAFVPEPPTAQATCRALVSAISLGLERGEDAVDELTAVIDPYLRPVREPLESAMATVTERIASQPGVKDVISSVSGLAKPFIGDAVAFGGRLANHIADVRKVLLDPDLACSGDAKALMAALKPYLGDLGAHFATVSLTASFKHPSYTPRLEVSLTFATNLVDKAGLYLGFGLAGVLPVDPSPLNVMLSGALYPKRTLADFALSPVPETAISFAKGGAWDQVVEKLPPLSALGAADSIDVAWDWNTAHIPAFGLSKELFSAGSQQAKGAFAVSGAVRWGAPLLVLE